MTFRQGILMKCILCQDKSMPLTESHKFKIITNLKNKIKKIRNVHEVMKYLKPKRTTKTTVSISAAICMDKHDNYALL